MGALEGRVAIITGAGRGLGRQHALLLAREGAKVVVNDRGVSPEGSGTDGGPAQRVVDEIRAAGGEAIADAENVADWGGGRRVVERAVDAFGRLDILVNNAGILRDRAIVTMTEEDFDAVVSVHLKGHFVPLRWAAAYWREQTKAGEDVRASVINTTSTSGLFANPGQSNYGAAKTAIVSLTQIAAKELARYGVRVNAIAPAGRTRLTESTPGVAEVIRPPSDPDEFDEWDPAHVSPFVAYLAMADCPFTGEVFSVQGGTIRRVQSWRYAETIERQGRWTVEELVVEAKKLLGE